jgi:hypothetical protein
MVKSCCLLYLVCFIGVCFAQTKETYYGEVLIKTENLLKQLLLRKINANDEK